MEDVHKYLNSCIVTHPKKGLFNCICYNTRKAAAIGSSGLSGLHYLSLYAKDSNTTPEIYTLGKPIIQIIST